MSAVTYTKPNKRRAHDYIRDCLEAILKHIVVTASYAPYNDFVYSEERGLIDACPKRRPLDVSFNIDKATLSDVSSGSTLDRVSLNVTLVHFKPHSASISTHTPK